MNDLSIYRQYHESAKHWSVRLEFLKQNFENFENDINRLLCLSICYVNMLFLGSRYPIETLDEIRELSTSLRPLDEIFQESENQLKKSRKRKFDEMVGDREKYIIPDKKRLLLKSPLEFIKSKTIVQEARKGTVIEPEITKNHDDQREKPKWLNPKRSKFLLDKDASNVTPMEFSLKEVSTILAGGIPPKKLTEKKSSVELPKSNLKTEVKPRNELTFVEKLQKSDEIKVKLKEQFCDKHIEINSNHSTILKRIRHAIFEAGRTTNRSHRGGYRRPCERNRNQLQSGVQVYESAFKRAGLELVTETFSIGKMLSDFNSYMQSDADKISGNHNHSREIHGHYRCSIISCENIEVGYAIHQNSDISKEIAFENVRQLFRNQQNLYVISAGRLLNGGLLQCQLTISNNNENISKIGYLPPKLTSKDGRFLSNIADLTVFIRGEMDSFAIVSRTAQLNGYQEEYFQEFIGSGCSTVLKIGCVEIARGVGENKKLSKRDAANNGANILKEKCRVVDETVKKGMETVSINDLTGNKDDAQSSQAFHNDKGAVLMKLMGWKGGGLGRDEDGRTDIVEHNQARSGWDRGCIGTGADGRAKVTIEQAEIIVARYAQSSIMEDIAFSSELGNEERKIIHRGAQKYGLKSKSTGKGDQRYLVLGRTPRQKLLFLQQNESQT